MLLPAPQPSSGCFVGLLGRGPDTQALVPAPPAEVPEPPVVGTLLPPLSPSQVRHNYHPECEAALNKHIHLELPAFYVYLSLAFCFDRREVPLKHFAAFCLWQWKEEPEQAQVLMRLQNQRGGASTWAMSRGPTVAAERAAGGPGNPPCRWRGR